METVTLTLNKISTEKAAKVLALIDEAAIEAGSSVAITPAKTTAAPKTTKKKTAAAPTPTIEDTDPLGIGEEMAAEQQATEDGDLDFMNAEPEPTPEPAKKKAATTKVTDKMVNDACVAHAKKHGRPATLEILKTKFGVKSITELEAKDYAAAIKALKV